MLFSAEVRWFWPGSLPANLRARFRGATLSLGRAHDAALSRDEPARTDTYLVMPGSASVGVKLRQGMFEIKARRSMPELLEVAGYGTGFADTWCKTSMSASGIVPGDLWPEDRELLWHIVKRRTLRKYVVEDEPESCPVAQLPDSGCNVEIVEIQRVDGSGAKASELADPWHSLAFEAFGHVEKIEEIRDRAVQALIPLLDPQGAGLVLTREHSLSYPGWLTLSL